MWQKEEEKEEEEEEEEEEEGFKNRMKGGNRVQLPVSEI